MACNDWWADDPAEIYWMEITDLDDSAANFRRHNAIGQVERSSTFVSLVQPGDWVFHWPRSNLALVGWSEAVGPLGSETREWQARARRADMGRAHGGADVGHAFTGLRPLPQAITEPSSMGSSSTTCSVFSRPSRKPCTGPSMLRCSSAEAASPDVVNVDQSGFC